MGRYRDETRQDRGDGSGACAVALSQYVALASCHYFVEYGFGIQSVLSKENLLSL